MNQMEDAMNDNGRTLADELTFLNGLHARLAEVSGRAYGQRQHVLLDGLAAQRRTCERKRSIAYLVARLHEALVDQSLDEVRRIGRRLASFAHLILTDETRIRNAVRRAFGEGC